MEAMGVTGTANLSSLTCRLQNLNGFTSSTPPSPQLHYAKKSKQRKLAAAAEDGVPAVEGGRHLKTVTDSIIRERGKLAFAPLLAGLANVQSALAISYDEVVGNVQEAATSTTDSLNLDVPQVDTSGLTDLVSSNPLAILGGVAVLALPFIASTVFKQSEGTGTVSAKEAYTKLGDKTVVSQILDIRVGDDIKFEGTPDLKKYRKKVTQLPYTGEPDAYLAKVLSKFRGAENTTIYVLDRFDGKSSAVAKLLAKSGFKAAYAIKDGTEGPSGWQNSELPWLVPSKGFSVDLGVFKDNENIVPTTLGVAAAAGVGFAVFSEAETALQLLGSAALLQIFVKKFLFAKDRKKTFEDLRAFLDTKVVPPELVNELKGIANTVLPKGEEVQSATINGAASLENRLETAVDETSASVKDGAAKLENTVETVVDETPASASVKDGAAKLENTLETAVDESSASVKDGAAKLENTLETSVDETSASVKDGAEKLENTLETAVDEAPASVEDGAAKLGKTLETPVDETSASVEAETTPPPAETPVTVEAETTSPPAETPTSVEAETTPPLAETPAPAETPTPAEPKEEKVGVEELVSPASASSTDLPRTPEPLSPYTQYSGLKPPTSPTPSRP